MSVQGRLPHRHPFMMLDRAEIIEAGKHARGAKLITSNDPVVFPAGALPDCYVIEAMAHVSGLATGIQGVSLFAGLKDIKFSGAASAGDVLEIESVLERNFGGIYIFSCKSSVSGKLIAEGGIILHFDEGA